MNAQEVNQHVNAVIENYAQIFDGLRPGRIKMNTANAKMLTESVHGVNTPKSLELIKFFRGSDIEVDDTLGPDDFVIE